VDSRFQRTIGGRIGGPGRAIAGVTLVIEDKDGAFHVTRRVSMGQAGAPDLVQRFRLDGKESVNRAPAPGGARGEASSNARREAGRVIVESRLWITAEIELKTTEIFEVSEDAATLTVRTMRTNHMATQSGKQIYRRN